MLLIEDILVSDDLIKEHFLCDLQACKGACCFEGDCGAPLEPEEMTLLEEIFDKISTVLPEENLKVIRESGLYRYYKENGEYGTTLMDDGRCVFMISSNGIAKCGIETVFKKGLIQFQKPISCHLYPVRVKKNKSLGFEALNYDQWKICSTACAFGKQRKVKLFNFVKTALVRKYGEAFFEALEACAIDL